MKSIELDQVIHGETAAYAPSSEHDLSIMDKRGRLVRAYDYNYNAHGQVVVPLHRRSLRDVMHSLGKLTSQDSARVCYRLTKTDAYVGVLVARRRY